jgi:hypothetical protein
MQTPNQILGNFLEKWTINILEKLTLEGYLGEAMMKGF